MSFTHFLARVTDDNWTGFVGPNQLLLSFGPEAREAIRLALRTLRERPEWQSIGLEAAALTDCTAKLVPTHDGLLSMAVEELVAQVGEADKPVVVPSADLKEVLLLLNEYDDTEVAGLNVYGEGSTLEVSVRLPDVLRGRRFVVHGGLDVVDLPQAFRGAPAQ